MLGRLGASGLRRHLFGTVSSTLVQIADVPVTVVP
jgi:nucleotide-binding universal stress UspA family protein